MRALSGANSFRLDDTQALMFARRGSGVDDRPVRHGRRRALGQQSRRRRVDDGSARDQRLRADRQHPERNIVYWTVRAGDDRVARRDGSVGEERLQPGHERRKHLNGRIEWPFPGMGRIDLRRAPKAAAALDQPVQHLHGRRDLDGAQPDPREGARALARHQQGQRPDLAGRGIGGRGRIREERDEVVAARGLGVGAAVAN
jgi:hypothetical protein